MSGSIQFNSGTSTDLVDCGNAASLNNLAQGTFMSWAYLVTTGSFGGILIKMDSGGVAGPGLFLASASNFVEFDRYRATTTLSAAASTLPLLVNTWMFAAATFNSAGAATDQKLYIGDLQTLCREPTYSVQQVGSGALVSDTANHLGIGGLPTQTWLGFGGRISMVAIWNRVLSTEELRHQQFNPHPTPGCVLFTVLGESGSVGLGLQIDRSGYGNHGTVASGASAPGIPLKFLTARPRPLVGVPSPPGIITASAGAMALGVLSPFGTITGESAAVALSASASASMLVRNGQYAAPTSDILDGAWTTETGVAPTYGQHNYGASNYSQTPNLYVSIGETVVDDTTYVQSELNPDSSQMTIRLGPQPSAPNPGPITFSIRHANSPGNGQTNYTYELMQGATVLQTFGPYSVTSSIVAQIDTLVTASITDWATPFDVRTTATRIS